MHIIAASTMPAILELVLETIMSVGSTAKVARCPAGEIQIWPESLRLLRKLVEAEIPDQP
jgi:hypothetical protein